jgi:hypothetical protein
MLSNVQLKFLWPFHLLQKPIIKVCKIIMLPFLNGCKAFFPVWAKNEATGGGWKTILKPAEIN